MHYTNGEGTAMRPQKGAEWKWDSSASIKHRTDRRGRDWVHPLVCAWYGEDGTGLTHCLRAWFLRLKYRISFFRIAWFLGSTDRGQNGQFSAGAQLISTGCQSEGIHSVPLKIPVPPTTPRPPMFANLTILIPLSHTHRYQSTKFNPLLPGGK